MRKEIAEQGLKLAADAQQAPAQNTEKQTEKREKTAQVKQRRQRRQLQKKVRTGKAVEAETDAVVVTAPVEAQQPNTEVNTEKNTERKEGQRRNRRSPRHLRASGQRRRRRDRRPVNPSRLSSGVASPEMAMGKAYPDFARILEMKQAKQRQQEKFVDNETQAAQDKAPKVKVQIGGVAFPEMAMGKVLLPYVEASVAPIKEAVQTPVVEEVKETTPAPVAVEATVTEAPIATPVVDVVAEAPVKPAAEVNEIAVAAVETVVEVEEVQPVVETKVAPKTQYKGHASSGMTKATGPTEIKEITVTAAEFRTERFAPKQAGSQTATSQASAAMAKTAGL